MELDFIPTSNLLFQVEEEQSRLEAEIKSVETQRREIHIEMEKLEMKAKEVDDLALK